MVIAQRLMVTLAWGNVLAILLPGVPAVFAFRRIDPTIAQLLSTPGELTVPGAFFLLIAAALAGGVLEALRRVTLDQLLVWRQRQAGVSRKNLYDYVTPKNLALFEAGVENSYKYYAFYGNLMFGIWTLLLSRWIDHTFGSLDVVLLITTGVLGYAAWVQYGYFQGFTQGFIAAEERAREGSS